jgi:hypothetical protein
VVRNDCLVCAGGAYFAAHLMEALQSGDYPIVAGSPRGLIMDSAPNNIRALVPWPSYPFEYQGSPRNAATAAATTVLSARIFTAVAGSDSDSLSPMRQTFARGFTSAAAGALGPFAPKSLEEFVKAYDHPVILPVVRCPEWTCVLHCAGKGFKLNAFRDPFHVLTRS